MARMQGTNRIIYTVTIEQTRNLYRCLPSQKKKKLAGSFLLFLAASTLIIEEKEQTALQVHVFRGWIIRC